MFTFATAVLVILGVLAWLVFMFAGWIGWQYAKARWFGRQKHGQ